MNFSFSVFFLFLNCLTTYGTNFLTLLFHGFVYYTNTLALFSLCVDMGGSFWFDSIQQLSVVFYFGRNNTRVPKEKLEKKQHLLESMVIICLGRDLSISYLVQRVLSVFVHGGYALF